MVTVRSVKKQWRGKGRTVTVTARLYKLCPRPGALSVSPPNPPESKEVVVALLRIHYRCLGGL